MIGYITVDINDTSIMNRVMVKYSTHGELMQEVSKLIDESVEIVKKDLPLLDLGYINMRNVSSMGDEVHYVVELVMNFEGLV